MKYNWFECVIRVYDGLGQEMEISDLPAKQKREVANQIVKGHRCGSFENYIDSKRAEEMPDDLIKKIEAVVALKKQQLQQMEEEAELRRNEVPVEPKEEEITE